MFVGLLDETVMSAHACGEDIVIMENFMYHGSVVHNDGVSSQEIAQWIGLAHSVMDTLNTSI